MHVGLAVMLLMFIEHYYPGPPTVRHPQATSYREKEMQMQRESCEASPYGPIHNSTFDRFEVQVVESAAFEPYVRALGAATVQAREHFKCAITSEGNRLIFIFGSLVPVQRDMINQDFAFARRREACRVCRQ